MVGSVVQMVVASLHTDIAPVQIVVASLHTDIAPVQMVVVSLHTDIAPLQMVVVASPSSHPRVHHGWLVSEVT